MKGVKFFLILIIGLAVVVAAANSVWLLPALDTINRGVSDLHLETARRAGAVLKSSLDEVKDSMRESANLIGQNPALAGEITARLLDNNPSLEEAAFVDAKGLEKFKVSRVKFISDLDLGSRKNEAAFEEIVGGGKDGYDGPVFFSLFAEPLMDVSVPVRSPSGRTIGALIASNNLRFLWDLTSQVNAGPGTRIYVVDQNKNLIADPNPSIVLRGENLSYRSIVNKVIGGQVVDGLSPEDLYANFEGETVFAVGLPVVNPPWGIIVEQNYDDAFSSRRRIVVFAVLFVVFAVGLLAVLLWVMRRLFGLFSALELEKKQTLAIISNLTDGLIEYSEDFKVNFINPAAEKILGVSSSDVVGRQFLPKDSTEIKFSSFSLVLFPILADEARSIQADSDHLKTIELKIHHPLDRDLQVVTVPIINESGRIFSYLKVIRDVTREKAISRTKSEFISLAAHQLRTPLSAIKWTFSMILSGDAGAIGDQVKSLLITGFRSNERMITLVNDLLNVARIEEGRFGYKFETGNVAEAVKTLAGSLDLLAKELGVSLAFIEPPRPLPNIFFDREKLLLAVNNLIDNAMRYTHKPDGKVEVRIYAEGEFIKIEVKDNGAGMPKEFLPKLFTKFQRGPNAIKMYTEGSGLGLFIVKNIIKRHGGDVVVESEEGKGSRFSLSLPIDEKKIPPVAEIYEGV